MDVSEKVLEKIITSRSTRQPLGSADNNNGTTGRSRTREVSSRYRSPSPSPSVDRGPLRIPSPNARRLSTPTPTVPKRATSADRKRPSRPSSPGSPSTSTPFKDTAAEMLLASRKITGNKLPEALWPSTMRSLSVSFQSDTISVPVSKREKPVSHTSSDRTLRPSSNVAKKQGETPTLRKPTPERKISPHNGKNFAILSENSKPLAGSHARLVDQHRWPSTTTGNIASAALNKSMDSLDKPSLRRLSLDGACKPSQKSARDLLMEISRDDSRKSTLIGCSGDENLMRIKKTSSSSSDRTLSVNTAAKALSLPSPRSRPQSPSPSFSRRRPQSPSPSFSRGRPQSPSPSFSRGRPQSPSPSFSRGRPQSPSPSFSRGRPQSPSFSRGVSPSRSISVNPSSRPSSPSKQHQSSSSVLSFIVDIKKGKKAADNIEDVHQLRMLYNRDLQWRYTNARTDAALHAQKLKAEKKLYNVWRTINSTWGSVIEKKIDLQQLKLKWILYSALNNQLRWLDEWASIERDHTNSLTCAIKDLMASTIRVPLTGGARGDVESVKAAVCSAVDIMQAMGSSLSSILSRVDEMKLLVSELADVAARERAMFDEFHSLWGSTSVLQVGEQSLRTHLMQMKQSYGEPLSVHQY